MKICNRCREHIREKEQALASQHDAENLFSYLVKGNGHSDGISSKRPMQLNTSATYTRRET